MDDNILNIALANLIFGVLALTIGDLYMLPRDYVGASGPAPFLLAAGQQ